MSEIPEQDRVKLRPPPHMVTLQFGSQWNVVTPAVYRYEDQRWIDEFFDTGKLRLSTFAKFATYEDEVRGDKNEGQGFCYGETSDNKSVVVMQSQGINAAVLCCSHRLCQDLQHGFQRNSAFQITNTVGFSLEISRQLAGFRNGIEGSCIYRSDATISRAIDFDFEKYKLPDGNLDMQMVADASTQLGGPELLLLKRKRYERQQEYRLLWEIDTIGADYVDVVAPLARQFCRKVEAEDWGG
ncbi:hypothetical protein HL653_18950 [Sphingomonas sp. AP4-R1]|uniref:hypothetical protein n=1 Tax=Sphingomonas sp. AP4-R1 TaxID=2735134 RepID=UPI001493C972|nr:hypothetical protein [Sphingomonas sp. AP4-R1]QJU59556.1 hypothetical protein HL653_18950 [Sphingomonas sp. AP4-R1]